MDNLVNLKISLICGGIALTGGSEAAVRSL